MEKISVRDRNEQIEDLYFAGASYRQIAAKVGMSLHGVYRVCHVKLDLPRRSERAT